MPVSSADFRDTLRYFSSGVTIVTIHAPGQAEPHGLTVSSFISVSPEPPLILISIDRNARGNTLLQQQGAVFAVNILAADQADLSDRFAWLKDEDRFLEGDWETAVTGAPILQNALAWLDCTVHTHFETGTHILYVGEVQARSIPRPNDDPLVYWNRSYRQLALPSTEE